MASRAILVTTMNPAIAVESLSFAWPGSAPLFGGLSFEVARGESMAVVGASGSGKSSLLALLAGLERPSAGRILVDGEELARPRPGTGLVLQDHGLLPWATIRDNVALGAKVRRFYGPDGLHAPPAPLAQMKGKTPMPRKSPEKRARRAARTAPEDDRAVEAWLERLGIDSIAGAWPSRVSGGQRQRAAIARSLVLEPDIILMDEPFASLDEATREDLRALTLEIRAERGMTLVFVTHSIDEALIVGDRILLLEGRSAGTESTGAADAAETRYRLFANSPGDMATRAGLKAALRAALGAAS